MTNDRTIRLATPTDMNDIMSVMDAARGIMRASGNMHQWIGGYPSVEVVTTDMDSHGGFVIITTTS